MAEASSLGTGRILTGLLGVMVAIGLWWLYFDLISHRAPVSRGTQLWLYLHLPLVMAIAAGGTGVLNTVEHSGDPLPDAVRWLLVGSLAVAMASILFLSLVLEARRPRPDLYRAVDAALLVGIVATLALGLTGLTALASLATMVVLLLLPIAPAIAKWAKDVTV